MVGTAASPPPEESINFASVTSLRSGAVLTIPCRTPPTRVREADRSKIAARPPGSQRDSHRLEVGGGPCTCSRPGHPQAPWPTSTTATIPTLKGSTKPAHRQRSCQVGAGKPICTTGSRGSILRHDPTPPASLEAARSGDVSPASTTTGRSGRHCPECIRGIAHAAFPVAQRDSSVPGGRSSGNRLRRIVKRTLPGVKARL